jgi:hypothetical protein
MNSRMEVRDSSRIPKTVVRLASPTVKPMEARLTLSYCCIYVIFFGPKGHFVISTYVTEHGIWLSYCYYTCDLNILGTRMEASFPLSRNGYDSLLLLPCFSPLHAMSHLPPAHHKTSKRDSPNETKVKEKQNYPGFKFKPR